MFTNFDNTFKNSKKDKTKLPKEILDVLNRKIPEELEYKEIENGICGIVPKNSKTIKFTTKIKIPEIPEEIKKQIHNFEDLYEYLYRTQKRCEIIPDENGNIKINNVKIKINDFIKNVITDEGMKTFELIPRNFPNAVRINIKAGNITKSFNIKRLPYESMDKIYLKSIEEKPICIKIYMSNAENVDFNISISIEGIKDVKEIVDVCEFYKSFLNGDISLDNSEIKDIKYKEVPKNIFIDEKINFWKKVLEVEKIFDKKFDACKFDEKYDYVLMLRLYKSLIEEKPYKIPEKISSITFENKENYDKCNKMIGSKMLIEYEREAECDILGENIHFWVLERIYNCKIKNILEEKDKIKIIFDDYEKNNTFIARKCFLSKDKLENEKEKNKNNGHYEYENAEII